MCGMKKTIAVLASVMIAGGALAAARHTFEVSYDRDAFLLDGEVMQIRCGEVHFARVPRAYWRHRIQMCKAMGLNAVCAYMFWNYHEMERGQYDFDGEKDVAEFCRIAQEEGMWVVLRPGPYTCAEWEFGGLPWHLLSNGTIPLRSRDPRFLGPAKAWLKRVGDELRDLQVTRGGPILMVQDENEYGFFGDDREYIRELYNTLREAGFDVPIFTCNPAYHLKKGVIPEVVKVVNFPANPTNAFARLREVQPRGPLMCGEYYPAWYDSWGQRHHTKPTQNMLNDLDTILSMGGSFSLYMAHGGTSFGWWAGCNSPFQPQTSSYDYEAPISEQGQATPKFFALRELMKKHMKPEEVAALPEPPAPIPTMAFASDAEAEIVVPSVREYRLHDRMTQPLSFERLGQGYGVISYIFDGLNGRGGTLMAPNMCDQAAVFGDCKFLGFLDRRYPNRRIEVEPGTRCLIVIVTHMSRYNFGAAMNNSEKGLLPPVTLNGEELVGWWAAGAGPDTEFMVAPTGYTNLFPPDTPCTFKRFKVTIAPGTSHQAPGTIPDTWLLVRGWKKGHVWVNGHPLGRFWGIGPTQTMYVPGCWLREGENEFLVWDFGGNVPMKGLTFVDTPVLDEMHPEDDFIAAPKRESAPYTPPENPTMRGQFPDTVEAQIVQLPAPCKAKKFAFVADSEWGKSGVAAIAEFELLDEKGASIPHDKWKFVSVSSEESNTEDGMAENAIDGQIANFWHSRWSSDKAKAPHYLVIDLGGENEISGFRYTPRQNSSNGHIKDWRFFCE